MLDKLTTLRSLRFGERIAEEELNELEQYFVATDQWNRVYSGEVDIVYGSKGAGKSAIYALIDKRQNELFDRRILVRSAENIRGNTAFSEIISDPPPLERNFIDLWKLYFLIITASTLRDYGITDKRATALIAALEQANLLPQEASLGQLFHRAKQLIWSYIFPDAESVEWTLAMDPITGLPIVTRKTNFVPKANEGAMVNLPLDDLLEAANSTLEAKDYSLWVLFDRLDVAFNDTPELEKNALRALFRMYNDFKRFERIKLKIFVRDDIWSRITEGGFSEASHITRTTTIAWNYESLVNLFSRRFLNNQKAREFLGIDANEIVDDYDKQVEMLSKIFPDKVETGNNPETFRWMTNRIQDGTGKSAPRELIHLSEMVRQQQVGRLERGEEEPIDEMLFDRPVFKPALKEVSKVRYEQTFKAENPSLASYTDKLKGQKAEHTLETLAAQWDVDPTTANSLIDRLIKAGFFERRAVKGSITYWVPFIYRDALELIQGKAAGMQGLAD